MTTTTPVAPFVEFVDRIGPGPGGAQPTVRLNLNDGATFKTLDGWATPPPPLLGAVIEGVVRDGGEIPAAAYGLRTITLPLAVEGATNAAVDAALSLLNRELNRESNILRWRTGDTTSYFLVERSPSYDYTAALWAEYRRPVVVLRAQPFALGNPVDLGPFVVSNNPAASAGQRLSIPAGLAGDVASYPLLRAMNSVAGIARLIVGTRRRGLPVSLETWITATNQFYGAGTAPAASGDANAAGPGVNYVRTQSSPGMATRVTFVVFTNDESRGTYRVWARVRSNGTTAAVQGVDGITRTVHLNGFGAVGTWHYVDAGLVTLPRSRGPASPGYGGTEADLGSQQIPLAGSYGNGTYLDWNGIVLVPADAEHSWTTGNVDTVSSLYLDGPNDEAYVATAGATPADPLTILPDVTVTARGGLPRIGPGGANALVVVASRDIGDDRIADSSTFWLRYWPHWLTPP